MLKVQKILDESEAQRVQQQLGQAAIVEEVFSRLQEIENNREHSSVIKPELGANFLSLEPKKRLLKPDFAFKSERVFRGSSPALQSSVLA